MNRPLPIRLLPKRFRETLYYRHYFSQHEAWRGLFAEAPLTFAPNVSMYGLLPGDVISGVLAFTGFYELTLTERIAELARTKTTFVDVGANMGYFSLLWAGINPQGRVIAFEAAPRNIAIIENNVARNALGQRITLIPKAAGKDAGTITFDAGPDQQTGWGGISAAASATTIEVPLVRLDQELPDTDIDVLKVDVEGADSWVLLGCEGLLKAKRIKMIFFEQNAERMKILGIEPGLAQNFLRKLDYSCIPFGSGDVEWVAYPK